ncbi:MAG TPA: helix-turn-helix transcriptional regulator [Opitutaceae bacterium]|nr:helix-turn-helix transcriptional regulator [Opitutaceae bacterium]
MSAPTSIAPHERVRQERLRLGWTQAATAFRAGVSIRNFARFELGGQTSVTHLLRIAAALGLSVELSPIPDSGIVPDPRAVRPRQRGVRQPASDTPKPGSGPAARSAPTPPKPGTYRPPALTETMPSSDAAAVAAAAKDHRDAIARLVAVIVRSRLTNWTAAQVTRNSMSSGSIPESEQPAYVAAVLAQLAQLTPENIVVYGCRPADLAAWQPAWHFDEPIHGALD